MRARGASEQGGAGAGRAPRVDEPVEPPGLPHLQTNAGTQQALSYLHVVEPPLVVDGRMGPKTKDAVKIFQQTHGPSVDGFVGPRTRAALRGALTAT